MNSKDAKKLRQFSRRSLADFGKQAFLEMYKHCPWYIPKWVWKRAVAKTMEKL